MKEAWRKVKESDFHEVSSLGRIRNSKTGRILKPWIHTTGYWMIHFSLKGRKLRIHRLVASVFIKNPKNKKTVNHKNGVKTDNRVGNLEWATQQENNVHARKTGLNTNVGENHNFAKLTYKQVVRIRTIYRPGKVKYSKATMSQYKIAKKFNVSQSVISNILTNKSWAVA